MTGVLAGSLPSLLVLVAGYAAVPPDDATSVALDAKGHVVRFTSDRTVRVEALVDCRWVGRYWSVEGRDPWPFELWDEEAFRVEIDKAPVRSGWRWVSASEARRTDQGARHVIVEIANDTRLSQYARIRFLTELPC